MSACAWTLGRALAYAAATAVVAILIASLIPGADAERFATTAYLAALVAAALLAIKWFFRGAPVTDSGRASGPVFPAVFTFACGVGALLLIGAAFVSEPGSEVLAVAGCVGLIAATALVRGGVIVAVNERLRRGDRLAAATRYAVAAAVAALAARALFSSHAGEGFARLAYAGAVGATVAVAASLIAPTAAGEAVRRRAARLAAALRAPESSRVFARIAQYGAATVIVALILASLVPEAYAERFTTTAYLATLFAALAIGMTWRLRDGALGGSRKGESIEWPRFALMVGALLVVGAGLAFSPLAEALAVCVCLYLIGATILKGSNEAA